ncbi:NTP transferase domain-containing protein [Coprothermobacteraceae bacterium]|nr:NTP transferase domain-containing protein [Coprothermobacteraceae bacterium]
MDVGILILAGSSEEPWTKKYGVRSKLELPINGTPLIVKTFQAAADTGIPYVVVTDPWLAQGYGIEPYAIATKDIVSTLLAGAEALDTEYLLVLSADMPFITAEGIQELIKEAESLPTAELYVLIVSKELLDQRFPGSTRTYVKLKEGQFKAANGVLLKKEVLLREAPRAEYMLKNRKNPVMFAGILGWTFIFKALTGQLDIPYVWNKVERQFGLKAQPVFTRRAEFGFDIDKEEHYLYTLELLKGVTP